MSKLKDDDLQIIYKLLSRLVSHLNSIPYQTEDAMVFVRPEDVAFISIDDKRINIHDIHGNVGSRFESLTTMETKLSEDPRFFRSHRSFLINLYQVASLSKSDKDNYKITFRGNCKETAQVSESRIQELKKLLSIDK